LERPHSSKSRFSFPPPSWKEKETIARDLDHQFLKPFRNRTTNICNIKYIPKMFCVKEKNRLLKKDALKEAAFTDHIKKHNVKPNVNICVCNF